MNRLWTKDSTGVATNGRWYAGDINQLQDAVAALSDFLQTLDVNVLRVGDASLQLLKYGSGEFRMTGALRTDGIFRALGGFYAGAFTTTARDAIASGFRPYGLVILNTTTNRLEINLGTDPSPVWTPVGVDPAGTLTFAGQPANNYFITAARTGDTNPRLKLREDGQIEIGPGNAATDVILKRSSAKTLQLNNNPVVSSIVDLYANRPAANTVGAGTVFTATDTLGRWTSDGAAWTLVSQGRPRISVATFTSAPFSTVPYDGQEVAILVDATNGIEWIFKYNSGSASARKWEYIGGPPLLAAVTSDDLVTSGGANNTYYDSPTVCSITIPLLGDYDFNFFSQYYGNGGGTFTVAAVFGAAAASPNDAAAIQSATAGTSTDRNSVGRSDMRRTGIAASTVVKLQFRTTNNVLTFRVQERHISARPVRV